MNINYNKQKVFYMLLTMFMPLALLGQISSDTTFGKTNLGPNINGPHEDIKPLISPDGSTLFFARQGTPHNVGGKDDPQDVYISKKIDGIWSLAENMGPPVNNRGPNGVSAVSPDGNTIVLINEYDKRKNDIVNVGFSISNKTAEGWSFPEKMEIKNLRLNNIDYIDFYITNNAQMLLMAVNRKGTVGDQDIFVSRKDGDGWGEPMNLGKEINTKGAEYSPFLASDGRTLYFASEAKGGLGGSDIYVTRRIDDTWTNWTTPKNLGPKVNTAKDDGYFSITAIGEVAYFVGESTEFGTNVNRDIFSIVLDSELRPDPVVLVYGTVYDSVTMETIEAEIVFEEIKSGRLEGTAHSSAKDGNYQIVLPYGMHYSLQAEAQGYLSVTESIDLTVKGEYKEIRQDLYLVPINVGQRLTLKNIFFEQSTPEFLASSFPELNRLTRLMKNNPNLVIRIEGHTDGRGFASSNMKLSQMRVEAVQSYMMERGIDEKRLELKAFGEGRPVAPNDTEEDRRKNRRVEVIILEL